MAEPWYRWGGALERWLEVASEAMLDLAEIGPGDRVLDVAAGAGGQSVRAAKQVGPTGSVLATDISPEILRYAERAAREANLTNLSTREIDIRGARPRARELRRRDQPTRLDLPARSRCRARRHPSGTETGRPRRQRQLHDLRAQRVLLDPGRDHPRARRAAPPAPGQPGPFSLGAEGAIETAYEGAGFSEVVVRRVTAPLRLDSAAEYVRFASDSFGALHQMLADLEETEQEETWAEIEAALRGFEGPDGFSGPCELVVAAARK